MTQKNNYFCINFCLHRFKKLDHKAPDPSVVEGLNDVEYTWPPNVNNVNGNIPVTVSSNREWVVTTGDTNSKVLFSLFTRAKSALLDLSEQSGATGSQSGPKTGEATTAKSAGYTSIAM